MDKEYYLTLAKVRMDRAKELLAESKELLVKEAYKSANNRAFYAIEKSVKALEMVLLPRRIIRKLPGRSRFVMLRIMMIFMLPVRKRHDSKWKMQNIW